MGIRRVYKKDNIGPSTKATGTSNIGQRAGKHKTISNEPRRRSSQVPPELPADAADCAAGRSTKSRVARLEGYHPDQSAAYQRYRELTDNEAGAAFCAY